MPKLRQLFRSSAAAGFSPFTALAAFAVLLNGCIFDSKFPAPGNPQIQSTRQLDTLLPANVQPDRMVALYQPVLDASLKPGAYTAPETFKPVNVRDHATKLVLQYQLTRQRFGSWSADREFQWNYFLLRANFLFPDGLPDTAGLQGKTQTLYEKLHPEDAFTHYFDSIAAPSIWTRINSSTRPGAIGVAVKLSLGGDSIVIQQVVAGSPAGRAGLVRGMYILAVNDSATVGDSALARFQRFSSGDSGSNVKLTVSGPLGNADYDLTREPVAFPTVSIDSIGGVGYISVSGFTPITVDSKSTYTEFRDALLATRGFPVTILDLRDNGGGSLDLAMRMCDEIVPQDTVIIRQVQRVFEEDSRVPLSTEIATLGSSGGVGETGPDGKRRKFLLLGNGNSASASEIFLVAVKEGAGAPLMGVRTYGKGVGQTVRKTPGKGLALVTFLKFTSRTRLEYHKIGLEPDIADSSASDALLANAAAKALEMASGPAAKVAGSATKVAGSARRDMAKRASAVDWNRRQAVIRGLTDLEPKGP